MTEPDNERVRAALDKIETTRKARSISVRTAAGKLHSISESYWRQLVAGGVHQNGVWVPRIPTEEQLLKMAAAVGVSSEIARDLGVDESALAPQETVVDRAELEELRAQLESILNRIDKIQRG
jgi:hypothetical protein